MTAGGVSPKSHRLTTQAFWLLIAKVIGFAIASVIPLVLVRVLDRTQFGLYKQAFLVVASAMAILPLNFALGVFYFLPREHDRKASVVMNIAVFNFAVGTVGFLALAIYPKLLIVIFGSAEMVPYARLIGLVIFLTVFSSFLELVAVAHQDVQYSTVFIVLAQLTKALFMAGAALFSPSVHSLLLAAAFQGLTQSAVLLWYLRQRFPGFWRMPDWQLMRTQLSYALPFGIAGVMYTLQTDLHNYFVANTFGAAAYAIYAIGCFQLPLLGILRDSIASVILPRVSALQQDGQHRQIIRLMTGVIRKVSLIYLPVYAFLLVSGREFLTVLFTSRYRDSWPIFAVNITLLPLSIVVNDPVVRAYAQYRYFFLWLRFVMLAVLLPVLWLGLTRGGMVGAIAAVVAVQFVERVAVTWRVVKAVGFRLEDLRLLADVWKIAVASASAGVLTYLLRWLLLGQRPFVILALCGVAFLLAYVAGIWALAIIEPDEKELIAGYWQRLRQFAPTR